MALRGIIYVIYDSILIRLQEIYAMRYFYDFYTAVCSYQNFLFLKAIKHFYLQK